MGHTSGMFPPDEGRLVLYVFFIVIFAVSFFCGFVPGMVFAVLSSVLAVSVLLPENVQFEQLSPSDIEIFPFISLYFLVAISVDWFRENIERLKDQLDENKRLQEQARHMEKLALAGEIAAGIAHEIRNPLTVVQGYLQLMSTKCQKRCNNEESYDLLIDEIKRANHIISDFLRFSRPDKPKKAMTDLNEIIEDTVSLVYGEALRRSVKLFVYPAPDLPKLRLDRDQMIQVFLNLFRNAVQAMPNGGTISVYTEIRKEYIVAKIIDSGVGMQPEVSEKIFSPFFTTKEEGTGLGLAITQSIIFSHRGNITVETIPSQGTEFTLTFPLADDDDGSGL
jgi:signal transduction histidine kinase